MIQTTVALVAAVVAYALVTLPPARLHFRQTLPATVAVGAYHIHTTNSDGAGTPDDVAESAAKAGLTFAILTDHGDGTRTPDAPRYANGVLLIDAAEISTVEGHVVALGVKTATPYRMAGEARDVIEDIHRLGGIAIVAHPDSQRPDLRWRPAGNVGPPNGPGFGRGGGAGNDLLGADGVEWLNADSEWRERPRMTVLNALIHTPFRAAESFTTLLQRPVATMRRWDALTRRRTTIGLSAVDAHGLVAGLYRTTFESFKQAIVLSGPLTGDAARDADLIIAAIRGGSAFSVITGIADPVAIDFTAQDDHQTVTMGGRLTEPSGRVRISASVPTPSTARVMIMHNDRAVAEGLGHAEVAGEPEPGAYRVEVWIGSFRIPWLVTNPIYIDGDVPTPPTAGPRPGAPRNPNTDAPLVDAATVSLPFSAAWAVEHSPGSSGSVVDGGSGRVDFQWQVGTQQPSTEFAALAYPIADGTEDAFDRVEFTASAVHPMRASVQFRMPNTKDERWGRSIFLDETPRPFTIRMADLTPQGFSANRRPVVARIKAMLLVIDTLNTVPGSQGAVHLSNVRLLRRAAATDSGPNGQQPVQGPGQEQQVRRPGREGGR